ncbi:hypothetical protein TRVA0_003S04566 [Trichomonascus vanleenenianus]|uniref:uncharacterized protein n=1 Tax=Trichomonascus vanleenenianus TaxID=2268995 RepID=UPI003ECAD95E
MSSSDSSSEIETSQVELTSGPIVSLFVGDLPEDTTEQDLWAHFAHYKPSIKSVKVLQSNSTYAYLSLSNEAASYSIIEQLNGTLIKGSPCRIMKALKQHELEKIKSGESESNLFVRNIDPCVTHRELYRTFSVFGKIVSCKLDSALHRAYVLYTSDQEARHAIAQSNGMYLGKQPLQVTRYLPRACRQLLFTSQTCVVVQYPPSSSGAGGYSEQDIYALLSPFGTIHCSYFPANGSLGYGYINFKSELVAAAATVVVNHAVKPLRMRLCGSPDQALLRRAFVIVSSRTTRSSVAARVRRLAGGDELTALIPGECLGCCCTIAAFSHEHVAYRVRYFLADPLLWIESLRVADNLTL